MTELRPPIAPIAIQGWSQAKVGPERSTANATGAATLSSRYGTTPVKTRETNT